MLAEIDINPNVIIVFVAMIIAGLKALIEKRNQQKQPPQAEDEGGYEELYDAYEAETRRALDARPTRSRCDGRGGSR